MHFDPVSFCIGELCNRAYMLQNEGLEGKEVFIVGSGPSIDHTRLDAVQNSIVVLLNSAYQLMHRFGENNRFYWFCQDTRALLKLGPLVPSGAKKIVTIHRFNRMMKVQGFMRASDIFLQPKFSFRRGSLQGARPARSRIRWSLVPRPRFKTTPPLLHDPSEKRIELLPSTVMLTAISIFGGLGAKRISCLGFDLTPINESASRVTGLVHQPYKTGALPADHIEAYLRGLKSELSDRRQDIVNCSPDSHERVLPRSDEYRKT